MDLVHLKAKQNKARLVLTAILSMMRKMNTGSQDMSKGSSGLGGPSPMATFANSNAAMPLRCIE